MAGSCECVNKTSGSIKCREFITEDLLASQEELCSMALICGHLRHFETQRELFNICIRMLSDCTFTYRTDVKPLCGKSTGDRSRSLHSC